MNIDLHKFCSNDIQKPDLCHPFNQGGFTNVTNGHLLIRMPIIDGYEEHTSPDLSKSLLELKKEPSEWFKCPVVEVVGPGVCLYCNGTKEGYICPECDGEGEVELSTDFSYYDNQDCKTCGGSGQIHGADLGRVKEREPYLTIDADKVPCIHCDGTGIAGYKHKGIEVGGIPFSDLYLSWLCKLPNCEIGIIGNECQPAKFRFDGGEGLIMPRRKD